MKLAVVYEDGSVASKARDEEQGNGDGSKGKYLERINQQKEGQLTGEVHGGTDYCANCQLFYAEITAYILPIFEVHKCLQNAFCAGESQC